MKKILLTLFGIVFMTMSLFAQGMGVATLCHNDSTISAYYGRGALVDACNAAAAGDVITLSAGFFNASNYTISKSITVRGAGCALDSVLHSYPTILTGSSDLKISANVVNFEGVYVENKVNLQTYGAVQFVKCRLSNVYCSSYTPAITFINSMIRSFTPYKSSSYIYNSILGYFNDSNHYADLECHNCFIKEYTDMKNSMFTNCIFEADQKSSTDSTLVTLSSTNIAYSCLGVGAKGDIFENVKRINNMSNQSIADFSVFKSYKGGMFKDDTNFELTPEAQKQYLGVDGKQVGIYGGDIPYDLVPTNPQIVKFNVDSKTTPDGMLNVDIQVGSAK